MAKQFNLKMDNLSKYKNNSGVLKKKAMIWMIEIVFLEANQ